jgi:hypothetical protein
VLGVSVIVCVRIGVCLSVSPGRQRQEKSWVIMISGNVNVLTSPLYITAKLLNFKSKANTTASFKSLVLPVLATRIQAVPQMV